MDTGFNCYHVFNKSIAGYTIFRDEKDYSRMLGILDYYRFASPPVRYSTFLETPLTSRSAFTENREDVVKIFAYCLMPTHFHLVLEPLTLTGISEYFRLSLNAYTRYFNERYARKGPLWQGRVKRVTVGVGDPFLHVTRYVHLNPVTAYMVEDPANWKYSSYMQYVNRADSVLEMPVMTDHVAMGPSVYRDFVLEYRQKQRDQVQFNQLFLE